MTFPHVLQFTLAAIWQSDINTREKSRDEIDGSLGHVRNIISDISLVEPSEVY